MKRIYLVLICVLGYGVLWAQCPPENITLSTQSDVNNFTSDYPNCTELLNNLWIEGSMTNLNGLSSIKSIDGTLYIRQSDYLTNLSGLNNLDSIGGALYARFNDNLISFSGLNNLKYIGDYMLVQWNAELSSVNGLNSLTYIGGDMDFYKNGKLYSLEAFSNLTTVNGRVEIEYNSSLSSLSGLDNISQVDYFRINNNPNLSVCNVESVCSHITSTFAYNNKTGCNNTAEIAANCSGPAQPCLTDGITFTSQQQIDSFAINYPDCTAIVGDVTIHGDSLTPITNLNGLSQINHIDGALIIRDNAALTNLNGLQFLLSARGGLDINNNDALENVYALNYLNDVQGELIIRNNETLTELNGLHNIQGAAISYLQIYDNPNLGTCNIMSVCAYFWGNDYEQSGTPQTANIFGNIVGNYYIGKKCGDEEEVYSGCYILPIQLTTFQSQIQQKTTLLTWQTATETHNSGFEIQRSKDATTWQKIGWQDGQGDSETPHDYTYTDENPLSGTSYYRLKQIDFDGTFSHSDIVKIDYGSSNVSIYPNPVKNTLYIADLNDNNIQNITIFDQMGRQAILQNTNANTLDVSMLPSGIYIIQVTLDSGVFSDRFIVK